MITINRKNVAKQNSTILGCPWEVWTEETTEGWGGQPTILGDTDVWNSLYSKSRGNSFSY